MFPGVVSRAMLAFDLSCAFLRLAVSVQYHLTTCHDVVQHLSHRQLWCARRPTSGTAAKAAAIQQQHEISSRILPTAGMAPLGWVPDPSASSSSSSSRPRRIRRRVWRDCRFRRRARRQAQLWRPPRTTGPPSLRPRSVSVKCLKKRSA